MSYVSSFSAVTTGVLFGSLLFLWTKCFWNSELLEGIRRQSLSRDPQKREVTDYFHSSGMRDVCDVEPAAHAMIHRTECARNVGPHAGASASAHPHVCWRAPPVTLQGWPQGTPPLAWLDAELGASGRGLVAFTRSVCFFSGVTYRMYRVSLQRRQESIWGMFFSCVRSVLAC